MEVITAILAIAALVAGLGLPVAHLIWGKASSGTLYFGLFLVCGVIANIVLTYFGIGPAVSVVDTSYARGSALAGKFGSVIGFLIGLGMIIKGLRAPVQDQVVTRIGRLTALVLASLAAGAAIPAWIAVQATKAEHLAKVQLAEFQQANSRLLNTLDQMPAPPKTLFRVDDLNLLSPASSWEVWNYPGSQGGCVPLNKEMGMFGVTQRITLVTPDEFDQVWAFYQEKCRIHDRFERSEFVPAEPALPRGTHDVVKLLDSAPAYSFEGPPSDALSARAFTLHSLRFQLVGFIYRPVGAKTTTILLAYRPNSEFLSLVKDRLAKD